MVEYGPVLPDDDVRASRFLLRLWFISLAGLVAILFAWHRMSGELPPIVAFVVAVVVLGPVLMLSLILPGPGSPPTPEQIEACRSGIQKLLDRRLANDAELRSLVEAEFANDSSESPADIVARIKSASEELDAEIWFYNTSPERWENLCGECGIAYVREGKVLHWEMWSMN